MASANNKAFLVALKKYHFWILFAIALLLGVGCWMMATTNLADQYKKRVSEVDGKFSAIQEIAGKPDYPNEKVVAEWQKKHTGLKDKVQVAWESLFKRQKDENKWPEELGTEFLQMSDALGPTGDFPTEMRESYQNKIKKRFAAWKEMIKVRRPVEEKGKDAEAARRAAADGEGKPDKRPMTGVVDWDPSDFGRIEDRYVWTSTPSTAQVRLAQEDLWVYEVLLRIIQDVNGNANAHETAPIKRIEALEIGQDASNAWAKIENAIRKFSRPSTGEGEGEAEQPPESRPAEGGEPPPDGAPTEDPAVTKLKDFRYVDANPRPQALRATDKHPFEEFKLMPIHVRLYMDSSRLPKLLTACANASMPVEARQIRINAADGGGASPGEKSDGERGGTGGSRRGMALGGAAGRRAGGLLTGESSSSEGDSAGPAARELTSTDVAVDVYGIITIFNPPRPKATSGDQPPADQAGGDQASPAAPAGQPAAGQAPADQQTAEKPAAASKDAAKE